jgi:hypothetical protein
MKKIFSALFFVVVVFGSCYAKSKPAPTDHSVTQVAGPAIVIPGLPSPVARLDGDIPLGMQWKLNGIHGSIVGTSREVFINRGDISYGAYFFVNSPCPNDEDCEPVLNFGGSISVPSLTQSISINHQLDGGNSSIITLSSNATQYLTAVEWFRNGISMGGGTSAIGVLMPGAYSAKVTYTYNGQSSAVVVDNAITVVPSPLAPVLSPPQYSYNPVVEPVITVANPSSFTNYEIRLNGTQILFQTHCASCGPITFRVTGPGTYMVGAISAQTPVMQYTDDIVIPNGALPEPGIVPSSPMLTYENPQLQLTAGAGTNTAATYDRGYTWYFNDTEIPGATGKTITVFKPGPYKVRACARYPDNSVPCVISQVFPLAGENVHVSFVRTKSPLVAKQLSTDVDALQFSDLNTSTAYFDGMSRPIQQVLKAASPMGHDVISINRYDAFGREQKQYLPFTRSSGDGSFLVMPQTLSPLMSFYSASDDKIADTTVPFGEVVFETSPLNRVLQQGSAGEEWQISNNHAKSFNYTTNVAADKVFIWVKTSTGASASSYYPVGTLAVTEVTDEDGNRSREFKDKDGRVVLSERIIEAGAKLRTYYVFDDMGRMQLVLPPKTISELPDATAVTITSEVLARECYSYEYDERGRQTVKNVPGAGSTYMMYDKWDRLVLAQSANQRATGRWTFNKYDALDRIIMTGEVALPGPYGVVQQALNVLYANVQTNSAVRYEERGGSIHGYTNRSFPVLSNQFQAYTISYYDNYDFLSQFGAGYDFADESMGTPTHSSLTRSLVTGTKVLILGGQTYLKTVNYYDSRHRVIQMISGNHQGGIDRVTNSLDFTGKIMRTRERHNGLQPVIIDQEFSYDHKGRSINAYHTINNGTKVQLSNKKYNELGQMIEQNIHSTDGNTFLQSQDYVYNIRGWLLNVNPVETESNVQFQDQFGFELSYTTAPAVSDLAGFRPAFNGNITAYTEVRPGSTTLDNKIFKNGFSYQYDARNQLTQANYFQVAGPAQTHNSTFDLPAINYDPNGNITFLERMGIIADGTNGKVDELHYDYNGNQLIGVTDGGDHSRGFIKK